VAAALPAAEARSGRSSLVSGLGTGLACGIKGHPPAERDLRGPWSPGSLPTHCARPNNPKSIQLATGTT
jgi:hypothetical protein